MNLDVHISVLPIILNIAWDISYKYYSEDVWKYTNKKDDQKEISEEQTRPAPAITSAVTSDRASSVSKEIVEDFKHESSDQFVGSNVVVRLPFKHAYINITKLLIPTSSSASSVGLN